MKKLVFLSAFLLVTTTIYAQKGKSKHPKTKGKGWTDLFTADLSNANYPDGIWTVENGELTASEDQAIWTEKTYDNFVLDLEFKNADGTNSGVIVYCSDVKNWIPNSVEIQIADDYAEKWANSAKDWQCAAIFGHLPANEQKVVKKPGEWNRYTITCIDQNISVVLNGKLVTEMDMSKWTSGTTNPDGSPIPSWLNKPFAELPTQGKIGLQGKHAGAPVWFRNMRIKELN
ncbi:3-keto-disaccharide hydrolase [Flexithrix dorotheae]|uniref:3-keto-disaccharide hydrolase n=1 Tax=Flexithrix dorotheae TaxID=70993 RepID=UPI000378E367|nr:DUF1080 domain-containing protein [Flexithrix dorotheae]